MNRRATQRAKVDLLINRFVDGRPYMCRMTDISATGLRLVPLIEPRHPPRFMGLQFQIPGVDAVFTAAAEAVNEMPCDQPSTGVRFTKLPADCVSAIRRFVDGN
jgi:hypothetical protein